MPSPERSDPSSRYAFQIGYLADGFAGYARQPGARTVEGVLRIGLQRRRISDLAGERELRTASRTDRGVHALGNVVSFSTRLTGEAAARALGSIDPQIFCFGWAPVPVDFQPRHARSRWYRYLEPAAGLHLPMWREGARLFEGEHEFVSFSRKDDPPRPTRLELTEVRVDARGDLLVVDLRAPRFLWNQVRKIIAALQLLDRGDLDLDALRSALAGERRLTVPAARADRLLLMEVDYGFPFRAARAATEHARRELLDRLEEARGRVDLLSQVVERVGGGAPRGTGRPSPAPARTP